MWIISLQAWKARVLSMAEKSITWMDELILQQRTTITFLRCQVDSPLSHSHGHDATSL